MSNLEEDIPVKPLPWFSCEQNFVEMSKKGNFCVRIGIYGSL